MFNSSLNPVFIMTLGIIFILVSLSGSFSVSSSTFGTINISEGPVISNVQVIPDEITPETESVTIKAEVNDSSSISWVRVYPCRYRTVPFSSICLFPVEMSEIDDGVWESTVSITGLNMEVDDEVGFNITAQNELGNQSHLYIKKIVLFLSVDSTIDSSISTSSDSPIPQQSSFSLAAISFGIAMVVVGRLFRRMRTSDI